MKKFTIITGNVVDGFEAYGIFDSEVAAISWADRDADLPDTWHVLPIEPSIYYPPPGDLEDTREDALRTARSFCARTEPDSEG